jgi:hypothetical protein
MGVHVSRVDTGMKTIASPKADAEVRARSLMKAGEFLPVHPWMRHASGLLEASVPRAGVRLLFFFTSSMRVCIRRTTPQS